MTSHPINTSGGLLALLMPTEMHDTQNRIISSEISLTNDLNVKMGVYLTCMFKGVRSRKHTFIFIPDRH